MDSSRMEDHKAKQPKCVELKEEGKDIIAEMKYLVKLKPFLYTFEEDRSDETTLIFKSVHFKITFGVQLHLYTNCEILKFGHVGVYYKNYLDRSENAKEWLPLNIQPHSPESKHLYKFDAQGVEIWEASNNNNIHTIDAIGKIFYTDLEAAIRESKLPIPLSDKQIYP